MRLLTRGDEEWDEALLRRRIREALAHRHYLMPDRASYRLIFSEGDLLPGLIVDRYGEHLVVQSLTAGMDRLLEGIVEGLMEEVKPRSIYLKSNSPYRQLEGLKEDCRPLVGETPEAIPFLENGLHFTAYPLHGQKTGFYLDQSHNRLLILPYVRGKRVLDLFAYTGSWGITALAGGAREAVMVESSQSAVLWGIEGARENGVASRAIFIHAEVEEFLKEEVKRGHKYDLVILDPPSLIPHRSAWEAGRRAYLQLNTLALKVIASGGILVTCSCSHLMSREDLLAVVGRAGVMSGRRVQLIAFGSQPPDHPILPGHPETEYLKVLIVRVG